MYNGQKLLIANRGEIAVRIIRTAKELGLATVAIYTPSDALSPHTLLANEAVALPCDSSVDSEAKAYLTGPAILDICKTHAVTLIHPGYGFLAENALFASLVAEAGITWLGPRAEIIKTMGLKHEARGVALQVGLSVVPGSGLLKSEADALGAARHVGYPIMLKATAGGGGLGMVICKSDEELQDTFSASQARAKVLFEDDGLYLERYFPTARHIEIQVFGNGIGDVVHMGERECSVQRRQQKIIEEAPSPFLVSRPDLRKKMCDAALRLCQSIKYNSAGTVEFLVNDITTDFYFLEMNTRIQVEHPVTEAIHPGLDLVALMIKQGIMERQGAISGGIGSGEPEMQQRTYDDLRIQGQDIAAHAIEGRVYAENPSQGFVPTPGLLQLVDLNSTHFDWLRVDSWVSTGLLVTPYFDALLCKLIVIGRTREEAILRFQWALEVCKIYGPPNNIEYLSAIANDGIFRAGNATTRFLGSFTYTPRELKIVSAGIESTVQDLPGRNMGLGIPRGGPMDPLAFRAGNILVGNPETMEALEIVLLPGVGFEAEFFVSAVICVTGKDVLVTLDGGLVEMWARIIVPRGGKLRVGVDAKNDNSATGFRIYLAIRGGFPRVPAYLGSKSTSMGLGGYQNRPLRVGDHLHLADCGPGARDDLPPLVLPRGLVPQYPRNWIIYVLPGPHDDSEFITQEGRDKFYATQWCVSMSSNRMGIRLESPEKIQWARRSGGEGGSHPSNILDNGYAPGTININGDTPVILTRDGPDMGGYVCVCTVASAEMWKLGQLNPGCFVEFRRVPWADSICLSDLPTRWLSLVKYSVENPGAEEMHLTPYSSALADSSQSPILRNSTHGNLPVVFRQAGDSAILVEFGGMSLDLNVRAHIHAFQLAIESTKFSGFSNLCPCVRSILCHFDPNVVSQDNALAFLSSTQASLPVTIAEMEFPGRKITFPIVLDDRWNREALDRYMRSLRKKAVYLPSNIEYLARNNGLAGGVEEVLKKLTASDWLVVGLGFYFACPFLVPIDPRCRIIGQKMNPSRTYTPRGAIAIAGPVAAIYPVESPGGYQLYGRTLPAWQTWGKGKDFSSERPWLLQPFDQIHFESVTEDEYVELERKFDIGKYEFKIEPVNFSMASYKTFTESIAAEVALFKTQQARGMLCEEQREQLYLQEWEAEKAANTNSSKDEDSESSHEGMATICAPLSASVWKIQGQLGDTIKTANDVVIILEAMKTEIPICAGEQNIGRTISKLGKGVAEGAVVHPGDTLLTLS
ncbi:allophanate hydrolase subunit 2-domain-containing protein [Collybia nuda]|uniref:Allophanate hydrolase subunit 2-domain-containing protein n=1 Tax=Collybia nuda TaxID=64659 RepID=A0A9P5YD47_9AGAR|nr:allophanate hydrolase subunit 2-domain-containing protein [Collybia nuda]